MSYLTIGFFVALMALMLLTRLSPRSVRHVLVLGASLAFCASWGLSSLLTVVAAIVVTHVGGLWIAAESIHGRRRFALAACVGLLLANLVFFKLNEVETGSWWAAHLRIVAPIGISYYSFKAISYLLEVYWENMPVQRRFTSVALFVSFFPQILSGPIQRPGTFFEQLDRTDSLRPSDENFALALPLLLLGAFEKAVIADRIGPLVAALDLNGGQSSLAALLADYAYTLQLFADFGGLTHIALGLGLLLGISGPPNFIAPFSARSLPDFWRRWHASLTSWLGDYLFLPLRMSLRSLGAWGLRLSLLINMTLIGVWHGFKTTYLVFGIFHGLLLVGSTLVQPRLNALLKKSAAFARLHRVLAPLLTFHLVVLGQVFFRAPDLGFAYDNLINIASLKGPGPFAFDLVDPALLKVGVVAALISLALGNGMLARWLNPARVLERRSELVRWTAYGVLSVLAVLAASATGGAFMYAKF